MSRKLAFYAAKEDYTSEDGSHGYGLVKAQWTPDSRFFVFSLENSGGHSPVHTPMRFYSRDYDQIFSVDDLLDDLVTDSQFRIIAPNRVTVRLNSMDRPVTHSFSTLLSTKARPDRDLAFVSCWTKSGGDYQPRSRKSTMLISKTGKRAYATSEASTTQGGGCESHTVLFVSNSRGSLMPVYKEEPHEGADGNGIRILGWSPDQTQLLAQVADWVWESDSGFDRSALVVDVSTLSARKIDAQKSLQERFGEQCGFDFQVLGWLSSSKIKLQVKPYFSETDDAPSCLKQTQTFSLDIRSNKLAAANP